MGAPDPFGQMRRQQEQLHRLLASPALKLLREQQDKIRDALDSPALRQAREAQDRINSAFELEALAVLLRPAALASSCVSSRKWPVSS